jgi:hypothetical protein
MPPNRMPRALLPESLPAPNPLETALLARKRAGRAGLRAAVRAGGNNPRVFPQVLLARQAGLAYSHPVRGLSARGGAMSAKALQGVSFFLLMALMLYVALRGGV